MYRFAPTTATSPGAAVTAQGEVSAQLVLQPEPFALNLTASPRQGGLLDVTVSSSVPLRSAPEVTLRQDGAQQSVAVGVAYDAAASVYRGQIPLDPDLPPSGHVAANAADAADRQMWALQPFQLTTVPSGQHTYLYSPDGQFSLVLLPHSLIAAGQVTIQQNTVGGDPPAGLSPVGPTYEVVLVGSDGHLAGNATINLHYEEENVAGIYPGSVRLYRWNGTYWVEVPGARHNSEAQVATASIDQLGIFALFGLPAEASDRRILLPILSR